jgi:hypothetical protein
MAVGTVLAAFGTALPESVMTLVAVTMMSAVDVSARRARYAPKIGGSGVAPEPVALDLVSEGATHRG